MARYDLVLVLGFFRRLTYYLSLIQALKSKYRIGLFSVPLDPNLKKKHSETQEQFVRDCIERGAELIEEDSVLTTTALIPQEPYLDEALECIRKGISAKRRIAALTLAWPGLHDSFIEALDIDTVLIVDRAFFEFLLQHRGDRSLYEGRKLVEIGLPYGKYPPFPEFQADYILAMPTPFSFPQEKDKWFFLRTVLLLFSWIETRDVIAHKPHNALEHDYFSRGRRRGLARRLRLLPRWLVEGLLNIGARTFPGSIGKRIGLLYTAFLYEIVLERVVPMSELTVNHHYAMEAFLPGVRKGVIGGLSNTIWGTLYFRLPFYNCVDRDRQDREAEEKLYKKDASQLLELNVEYFYVPYCQGHLEFDERLYEIIPQGAREGDLVEVISGEIDSVASTSEKG